MKVGTYDFFKRLFDIVFSLFAIFFLSPFLIVIAIIIEIDSKGPVLFVQNRIGKDKKIFRMLKFRTMKIDSPHDNPTHVLLNPNSHITRFGRFLRRSSIDELPQLFNIIKGDMSIIGPRPALWNQYDLITERDRYGANSIKPGLSGWAQVHGRDEVSVTEKAKLDGYYLKNKSFSLDIYIVLLTILKTITREGIKEGA